MNKIKNKIIFLGLILFNLSFANEGNLNNIKSWLENNKITNNLVNYRLDNGIELIIQADNRSPTVTHMLWVRVGSMDEADGLSGVAHALEHMMFKGTNILKAGEFSRKIADLGGIENAFTSRDYTGFYQQIPSKNLQEVMKLEANRFGFNQWKNKEFNSEIEVIKEERRMRTDDNSRGVLFERLFATMFSAHSYRRPIIGWMHEIESMKADDVRNFYNQWYVPENIAVVIVGDVNIEEVKHWANETYGQISARKLPERKKMSEPKSLGLKKVYVKQPAEQDFLALAWQIPALKQIENLNQEDKDALALMILSDILSGYKGARLEKLTKGKNNLATNIGASANIFARGLGNFILVGTPAKGKSTEKLEETLKNQIKLIAEKGVLEEELNRVKIQWLFYNIAEKDSLMSQAQSLGQNWILGLPINADELILNEVIKINSDDIKRVAKKYFNDDNLTIATLIPTK